MFCDDWWIFDEILQNRMLLHFRLYICILCVAQFDLFFLIFRTESLRECVTLRIICFITKLLNYLGHFCDTSTYPRKKTFIVIARLFQFGNKTVFGNRNFFTCQIIASIECVCMCGSCEIYPFFLYFNATVVHTHLT